MSEKWPRKQKVHGYGNDPLQATDDYPEGYNQALSDAEPYRAELENKVKVLREALKELVIEYYVNQLGGITVVKKAEQALKLTD